jgi:hypothetical protein
MFKSRRGEVAREMIFLIVIIAVGFMVVRRFMVSSTKNEVVDKQVATMKSDARDFAAQMFASAHEAEKHKNFIDWGLNTCFKDAFEYGLQKSGRRSYELDGVMFRDRLIDMIDERAKSENRAEVVAHLAMLREDLSKSRGEWYQVPHRKVEGG